MVCSVHPHWVLQYPRKRPTRREVRKGTENADSLSLLSPVVWGCPEQPRQRWVPEELQRGQHHTHPWWPLPLLLARWPQLRQLSQSGQTMDFMFLWKCMFGRMQVNEKLTKKGSRNQTPPPPNHLNWNNFYSATQPLHFVTFSFFGSQHLLYSKWIHFKNKTAGNSM